MQNIFSKNINIKLSLFCLLSILAIWIIPKFDPSTSGPGTVTVLGVGLVMALLTAGVIYFGANSSLNLPKKFFLFAFIYNVLIIVVKFAIAPLSIYQANKLVAFSFQINQNPLQLAIIAAVVYLLYYIVFSGIYFYFKKKAKKLIPQDAAISVEKTKKHKGIIFWGIVLLIGIIIFTGGGVIFLLPLFLSMNALQYLSFVFSTIFSLFIALSLIGAIFFVTAAFRSVTERAIIMRDITILASFFWFGVSFLLIYHALWVVYLFILTTIWPLRVVVPK